MRIGLVRFCCKSNAKASVLALNPEQGEPQGLVVAAGEQQQAAGA